MKSIISILAIVVAAVAAYFSYNFSQKFDATEKERTTTIATLKTVKIEADVTSKNVKDLKGTLATLTAAQGVATQTVDSLKSEESLLKSSAAKAADELKVQEEEFAKLDKAMEAIKATLAQIGQGVTLETLPDKIRELEVEKLAKEKKVDELTTLLEGANSRLATLRTELDDNAKRLVARSARISRNSTEAVVTAVNQDWAFLVIGAGVNSGYALDDELLVERDGKSIGRVKVSFNSPTQTVAEIDLQSVAAGVRFQPGDRVMLAKPIGN